MEEISFKIKNLAGNQLITPSLKSPETLSPTQGASFGDTLKEAIQKVNDTQIIADQGIQALSNGSTENIHNVMINMEKANISFELMLQVRNKVIDAYQEVMRTSM